MASLSQNNSTGNMQEVKSSSKGKSKVGKVLIMKGGMKKKLGILDFILRISAATSIMVATVTMGTIDVHLPFFTQFVQFEAEYTDLPPFQYFLLANALACGFIILVSLPLSILCILRPYTAMRVRFFLVIFDTVFLTLVTSAASASADIVYLGTYGNSNTNWLPFCDQYDQLCQSASNAVIASFVAVVFMIILVGVSAMALRRNA